MSLARRASWIAREFGTGSPTWRSRSGGVPRAQMGEDMRLLLAVSKATDRLNEKIGNVCNLLVLLACLVSAGNAMIRYAFNYNSNGWLEAQWYMFAIIVMLGSSYTFKRNEHVRVEILYLMLSERGQLWLDLIGSFVRADPGMPAVELSLLAAFLQFVSDRRDVRQCRWPSPLAGQIHVARRLFSSRLTRLL